MSSQQLYEDVASKHLRKTVKGTNIVVMKSATDGVKDADLAMLHSIAADDATEVMWFNKHLRPAKNLTAASEMFLQGIKVLRPAAVFNTFDIKRSKLRRLAKQQTDKRKALVRRKKEVAPTVAFRAAIDPRKVPRTGGHASPEEVRLLSRGMKKKAGKDGDEQQKGFFTKWRKTKAKKIGKGL